MRAVTTITATAAALVLATTGSSLAGQAGPSAGPPAGSAAGAAANRAGDGHAPTTTVDGRTVAEPNPYLGLVADPTTVNGAYWKRQLARESAARDTHRVDPPNPFVYEEQEPADTLGANDDQASAELLQRLGTDKRAAVRILGQLSQPDIDTEDLASDEDDGSIPLANETGIPEDTEGVLVESRIGNGPHGPNGDDSGDFDVFAVDAAAGDTITIDTRGSAVDTVVAVYDAEGTLVGVNDDVEPGDFDSLLRLPVDEDGTYYALVAGFNFFGPLPNDPFDSGSGNGSGDVGTYTMTLGVGDADLDYYAVRLKAGDVLGGTIGGSSSDLSVWRYDGRRVLGTTQDASSLYPVESPLPGGDTTAAYVAEKSGRYAVSTQAVTARTRSPSRSIGRAHRATRSGRPCSWTSTASGSTPGRSVAPGFVRCRRSPASSVAGACRSRPRTPSSTGSSPPCGRISGTTWSSTGSTTTCPSGS